MACFSQPLVAPDLGLLIQEFYANFIDVDANTLFQITNAATELQIIPLLELSYAKIATFVRGKSPEEIRTNFNIKNDLTPAEEALAQEEIKWVEGL